MRSKLKAWEIDLQETRNTMLVGDIGETVAFHYLTNHGFFLVCRSIKTQGHEIGLISAHYQMIRFDPLHYGSWLNDKQKRYLDNFPAWDYVAFKHEGFKKSAPYLVEVKTVRGKGRPHKKTKSNSILEAKKLKFKTLLLVVKLLEDWRILVEGKEL